VNCYSVLRLFQAARTPLQRAHTKRPAFVLIGAPISTITEMEAVARAPLGAYGLSKLSACYLIRKFHFENKWLITFVVDPGSVCAPAERSESQSLTMWVVDMYKRIWETREHDCSAAKKLPRRSSTVSAGFWQGYVHSHVCSMPTQLIKYCLGR
jgi:hypothetical protein